MPRDVAIVFVHGIHATNLDYSRPMQKRLLRALPRKLQHHARFKPVFWADIVRAHSQLYLSQAETTSGLSISPYRRFVVEGLGDAAAYQKTRNRENSAYYRIQQRVTEALEGIDARDDPNRPLIFIGHSLGCHIISSYAWDINRLKQMSDEELAEWNDEPATRFVQGLRSWSPFRRLDTFAGFVTMGSNMPLFTFTFGQENVYPISRYKDDGKKPAFPGHKLSEPVARSARWLNFYSRNDLLGFPLRPLNNAYHQEPRLEDVLVTSEGMLRARFYPPALNALPAHLGYWDNRTVVSRTAKLIESIIVGDDTVPAETPDSASVGAARRSA